MAGAPAPAPGAPGEKVRVLCLHGFTQNAEAFRAKTGSLRKKLKSIVDFVFVDAPHAAEGAFGVADERALGAADAAAGAGPRAWWLVGENTSPSAPSSRDASDDGAAPRAETTAVRPSGSREMRGWEDAAATIRAAVDAEGPFRGVLGFSQGASAAALALATIPELAASCDFAVLIAGFAPLDPAAAAALEPDAANRPRIAGARSLHVHGRGDRMVTRDRCLALARAFENPEIFEHDGGHGVPCDKTFREVVKTFIAENLPEAPRKTSE